MRRYVDEERRLDPTGATIGILYPANADVLFESGGGKFNHPGNTEFSFLIEVKLDAYGHDKKFEPPLFEDLITAVHQKHGRFLERDPQGRGWWVEIKDKKLLYKRLYAALYDQKKRAKSKRQQQNSMSQSSSLSAHYQEKKRPRLCQCSD